MLEVHRREDRWFGARLVDWWREKLAHLFGPRHAGLKLATILAIVPARVPLSRRRAISAFPPSTALEPLLQLAATAPFNGYIREAPVRAGDLVKQGDAPRAARRSRPQARAAEMAQPAGRAVEGAALGVRRAQPGAGADRDRAARAGARAGRTSRRAARPHDRDRAVRRRGRLRRPEPEPRRAGRAGHDPVRGGTAQRVSSRPQGRRRRRRIRATRPARNAADVGVPQRCDRLRGDEGHAGVDAARGQEFLPRRGQARPDRPAHAPEHGRRRQGRDRPAIVHLDLDAAGRQLAAAVLWSWLP